MSAPIPQAAFRDGAGDAPKVKRRRFTRADNDMIEALYRQGVSPSQIAAFVLDPAFARHIAFKNTAPRSSKQPTLARGCEAEPAARVTRRGDKRMHQSLPMVRKGETFFHGETCA